MIKQILHKLSVFTAQLVTGKSLFINRFQPVFYYPTSRQNFTPRI